MSRPIPDTKHTRRLKQQWTASDSSRTFAEHYNDIFSEDARNATERGWHLAALAIDAINQRWPHTHATISDWGILACWATVFDHWTKTTPEDITPAVNHFTEPPLAADICNQTYKMHNYPPPAQT